MSEVIIIGSPSTSFTFTERMSGVERYSASGSVEESFRITTRREVCTTHNGVVDLDCRSEVDAP